MFLGALPRKAGGSSALGKADHGEHPHGAGIGVSRHPREAGIRARRASACGGHPRVAGNLNYAGCAAASSYHYIEDGENLLTKFQKNSIFNSSGNMTSRKNVVSSARWMDA